MPTTLHDILDLEQPTIAMLQTSSLTSAVQQALERMITIGELAPGDKLNEATLAERLGVSRGPVREAFRMLEEAGLLTLKKNRGVYVRQVPLDEALEIYDLRAMMEAEVGALLAINATAEQIAALQTMLSSMEAAVAASDAPLYFQLNVEFHETLVSFAGNKKMFLLYRRLTRELDLFRRRNLSQQALLSNSIQEHREVLAAIASRDPERAAHTLRRHVRNSRERTAQSQSLSDDARDGAKP
jgi:phosphonate utilization transcriptional regulator